MSSPELGKKRKAPKEAQGGWRQGWAGRPGPRGEGNSPRGLVLHTSRELISGLPCYRRIWNKAGTC